MRFVTSSLRHLYYLYLVSLPGLAFAALHSRSIDEPRPDGLLRILLLIGLFLAVILYLGIIVEITPVPHSFVGILLLVAMPVVHVFGAGTQFDQSIWESLLSLFSVEATGLMLYILYLAVVHLPHEKDMAARIVVSSLLIIPACVSLALYVFIPLLRATEPGFFSYLLLFTAPLYVLAGHIVYSVRKDPFQYVIIGLILTLLLPAILEPFVF